MADAPTYRELLDAIDGLITFVENVEPIEVDVTGRKLVPVGGWYEAQKKGKKREVSPNTNRPREYVRQITDDEEADLLGKEIIVCRLAEALGVTHLLEPFSSAIDWSKTGIHVYPWDKRVNCGDGSQWGGKARRCRAIVAKLAGDTSINGDGETAADQIPPEGKLRRNDCWLQWSREFPAGTRNVNGKVRDRWNKADKSERDKYDMPEKIPSGKPGWDRVRKGIEEAAEREKDSGK